MAASQRPQWLTAVRCADRAEPVEEEPHRVNFLAQGSKQARFTAIGRARLRADVAGTLAHTPSSELRK